MKGLCQTDLKLILLFYSQFLKNSMLFENLGFDIQMSDLYIILLTDNIKTINI